MIPMHSTHDILTTLIHEQQEFFADDERVLGALSLAAAYVSRNARSTPRSTLYAAYANVIEDIDALRVAAPAVARRTATFLEDFYVNLPFRREYSSLYGSVPGHRD
jgi:hypothetical protein